MKAIAYTKPLPIEAEDALVELDLPAPAAPQGRELLVEIRAVSVNPVDAKQRRSVDPGPTPRVLGFDGAGVVRAVGPEAGANAAARSLIANAKCRHLNLGIAMV